MPSAVLNLDKPFGLTSQEAVTRVKRFYGARKAGHCGTLDPAATGVLIICLDQATRFADDLQAQRKIYEAVLKLGENTDTQDAEGVVLSRKDPSGLSDAEIRAVVSGFIGRIEQVPPMYSALKKDGDPLYRLARKGVTIDRPARLVEIDSIDNVDVKLPLVTFSVTCSKGVYIRTLCQDIGDRLGVGGHLQTLRRTAVGRFTLDSAVTVDRLSALDLIPAEEALSFMPSLEVGDEDVVRLRNGLTVSAAKGYPSILELAPDHKIRLMDRGGRFLGLGCIAEGLVRVDRLLPVE